MPTPQAASADETHRPGRVYWILAFGLMAFSTSAILIRLAGSAPGAAVAVWRTVFSALVLAPVALPRIGAEVRAFTRRDVALIVTSGVFLGLHFITWIESLYHTTVASASVLVSTTPIFLAVLGFVVLRERLRVPIVLAIVAAVLGAALMGWADAGGAAVRGHGALWGNTLALTAALLFSCYLLIGRVVRRKTSWLAYVFPLYCVVATTVLAYALATGTPLLGYDTMVYVWCGLMALGPQVLGHGSYNYAVKYFPAALLGLLALFEPAGASLLAYLLFGEAPGTVALAGMAIVILAVGFAIRYEYR